MKSSKRVLVAYDGSSDAVLGLDWAVAYAQQWSLPLEVLVSSGDLTYLPRAERTEAQVESLVGPWVVEASERLKESALTEWEVTHTRERVVPALVEDSRHAGLLVVGARGHGALAGMVLGSVSQHLARHAHCPVVVVRRDGGESRRVVVGVDGSAASRHALEFAFDHADRIGGSVHAVHAVSLGPVVAGPYDPHVAALVEHEKEAGERVLAEALAGFAEEHPDVEVRREVAVDPAVRALGQAAGGAAMVVVGSRGRGGFAGLLLGSVSASVLHHAACPVAVVR